jgi:hypothetical protein
MKLKNIKVAPAKSKNRKTYLENFEKSEIEVRIFDNKDIELIVGEGVPKDTEEKLVKAIIDKGFDELLEKKKDWSPKAEHKSDKGGLTAAGRASYNKATGGNRKAPHQVVDLEKEVFVQETLVRFVCME